MGCTVTTRLDARTVALGLAAVVYGCAPGPERTMIVGRTVEVAPADPEPDIVSTEQGWRGVIVASRSVDVRGEFGGQITAMPPTVGQTVAEGDPLAQLDRSVAKEDTRMRRAELRSAKARVREATVDRTSASKERGRVDRLHSDGFASREELDAAELALARTDATLAGAQADLSEVQAALERSTRQQAERTITAPFGGIVARRYVEVGDILAIGEPVVRLLEASSPIVAFAIPAGAAVPRSGSEVEVVATDGSASWSGTVVSAQPDADPRTGLLAVRARLGCQPSEGCAHATPVVVHPASNRPSP